VTVVVDQGTAIPILRLCAHVGMSRQNYYVARRQRQRREIDEALVVGLVQQVRRVHPRLGARKLLYLLRDDLAEAGVEIGRDRFFELLRAHGLLVERKRTWPKTTNSRHTLPVFRNLVADMALDAPNQVWVSDLTYIRTDEGFVYAAVVMDRFSRKIVGAHIGDSLESQACIEALARALADLPAESFPIHHSDRGCQYCCHAYVDRLRARGLAVSMTEEHHCYENAHAERVIGTLKGEYELDATFRTKRDAFRSFDPAVELYNHSRPHLSLNDDVPARVHARAA
jgi:putative transposase